MGMVVVGGVGVGFVSGFGNGRGVGDVMRRTVV